ncbi:hypothetical protein ACIRJR_18010 [Streptomyces sp. NPDC102402]|uniref:hypothetical protein n=1 Tax=Streptomyces sp. NPDC102402 TaxID=3366169 RepID=UPI00382E0A83
MPKHRHRIRRRSRAVIGLAVCATGMGLVQAPASAAEPVPTRAAEGWSAAGDTVVTGLRPSVVPASSRSAVLGDGYQDSADRIWTSSGDGRIYGILTR